MNTKVYTDWTTLIDTTVNYRILDTDKDYVTEIEAPGVSKKDVSAKIVVDRIGINYILRGKKIPLTVTYPVNTDLSVAKVLVENGLIKVTVPKNQKKLNMVDIPVE